MMKKDKDKTRSSRQAYNGSKQISFLPEPDFNLKVPAKNTLAFKALSLMLQGKKIAHPHFENKTASWRLAAHVHILRKMGWPVMSIEVPFNTLKKPKNRRIYRYFLSQEVMKKIKNEGVQCYVI